MRGRHHFARDIRGRDVVRRQLVPVVELVDSPIAAERRDDLAGLHGRRPRARHGVADKALPALKGTQGIAGPWASALPCRRCREHAARAAAPKRVHHECRCARQQAKYCARHASAQACRFCLPLSKRACYLRAQLYDFAWGRRRLVRCDFAIAGACWIRTPSGRRDSIRPTTRDIHAPLQIGHGFSPFFTGLHGQLRTETRRAAKAGRAGKDAALNARALTAVAQQAAVGDD